MTSRNRLLILAAAVTVNLAALAAVHGAMVETALQQQLARQRPELIIVTGPGVSQPTLATQSCPAPRAAAKQPERRLAA